MKRRQFLHRMGMGTMIIGFGAFPYEAIAKRKLQQLTILHTNDWHSRIDPFPMDGGRNQGLGGIARRASMINQVRQEGNEMLLLDSGDIFQGTPYFNFFKGEPEFKLMSSLKYDAATMGNHDFDEGLDGFKKVLPLAKFPFVISNYDFSDTQIKGSTQSYKVFQKGSIKVGVFGVGIELDGLVPTALSGDTRYLDPIKVGNKTARLLRSEEGCDLVICLSHLGFKYQSDKVSDVVLAKESEDIDIILGGHTHTFLEKAEVVANKKGKEVIINQAGWAGILLGRLDIYFENNFKKKCVSCGNTIVQ